MKASDNVFPVVLFAEGSAPATPAAGELKLYAKADGNLYFKNDAGVETQAGGGSGTGAWNSYTPALTAATTNPTLGTGASATGTYIQIGKTVHFRAVIKFGTSGVAAGSGTYQISLPVTAAAFLSPADRIGGADLNDNSAGAAYIGSLSPVDTSKVSLRVHGAGTATHAVPFAWAASDQIVVWGTYEAAA